MSGFSAWWDFSDVSSLTYDAGTIAQANDKSGNGRHLTAASGSRPAASTHASLAGGALGVAAFDGSNDRMDATDPVSGSFTVFVVAIKPDSAFTDVLFRVRGYSCYIASPGTSFQMWRGTAATSISATSTDWTTAKVHVRRLSTNLHNYYLNKTAKASATDGTGSTEAFRLGGEAASGFGNWVVGEVVVYPSALSVGDREAVTDYLAAKWSIT